MESVAHNPAAAGLTPCGHALASDVTAEAELVEQLAGRLVVVGGPCDSHSPWQRGSNEKANGLLRQYFPKGTNLNVFSPEHLRAVEDEINNRPRLILEDRTPAELFSALLASPDQPLLRR